VKNLKNVKYTNRTWVMATKQKNVKKSHKHCFSWIMARKLKNLENETQTLFDLECGKKSEKHGR
jgi:hypothetical protein